MHSNSICPETIHCQAEPIELFRAPHDRQCAQSTDLLLAKRVRGKMGPGAAALQLSQSHCRRNLAAICARVATVPRLPKQARRTSMTLVRPRRADSWRMRRRSPTRQARAMKPGIADTEATQGGAFVLRWPGRHRDPLGQSRRSARATTRRIALARQQDGHGPSRGNILSRFPGYT